MPKSTHRENAQGMVEFALILPLLLVLIMGVIEAGRLLFIYSAVYTSSREAARYGSAAGDIGNLSHSTHYEDCPGMLSAAKRVGSLAGIQDSDITITYDHGPDDPTTFADCSDIASQAVSLGDRVIVQVQTQYRPIVPLVNLPPFPISSISRRTILKDVSIDARPPGGATTPTVSFTLVSESFPEDVGSVSIHIRMDTPTSQNVTVPFSIGGSATQGSGADYTITGSPVVIPAGNTSADIVISVNDDSLYEDDETIALVLGTPTNAVKSATRDHDIVTILDNEDPPTVEFAAASQSWGESVGSMALVVQLSAVSGKDVSVPFSLDASSTATDGVDFTISAGPLFIPAGSPSASIFITVNDDTLDENDEKAVVTLGTPTNATLGAQIDHTAWIVDNDDPPVASFTWASQDVTESVGNFKIQVQLNTPSGLDVIVPYSVEGTATQGSDYIISASPVTIPAGNTTGDINVTVYDDGLLEPDETITVTMAAPLNASLGTPDVHEVTITGSITPPTVSFTTASQRGAEDVGSLTIVAQLSAASAQDVSVPFSLSGTAQQGSDYTISTSALLIPAGSSRASITLNVVDDFLDEDDETVVVSMGTPTNAVQGSPSVHTVTILDNDTATVAFTTDSQSLREDMGSMTIIAQLDMPSTKDVSVPFTVGGSATLGSDYTITSSPVIIPAGSTNANIVIQVIDDQEIESTETVLVTMGTPTNATRGTQYDVHTASISDNDVLVCPTVSSLSLYNDSPKLSFTVYNNMPGATLAEITGITINWSDSPVQQKLKSVTFGGTEIWDAIDNSPPTYLPLESGWKKTTTSSDRELAPNSYKEFLFFFTEDLDLTFSNYFVTLSFSNGCPPVSSGR